MLLLWDNRCPCLFAWFTALAFWIRRLCRRTVSRFQRVWWPAKPAWWAINASNTSSLTTKARACIIRNITSRASKFLTMAAITGISSNAIFLRWSLSHSKTAHEAIMHVRDEELDLIDPDSNCLPNVQSPARAWRLWYRIIECMKPAFRAQRSRWVAGGWIC